jgi:hypothetical protein
LPSSLAYSFSSSSDADEEISRIPTGLEAQLMVTFKDHMLLVASTRHCSTRRMQRMTGDGNNPWSSTLPMSLFSDSRSLREAIGRVAFSDSKSMAF